MKQAYNFAEQLGDYGDLPVEYWSADGQCLRLRPEGWTLSGRWYVGRDGRLHQTATAPGTKNRTEHERVICGPDLTFYQAAAVAHYNYQPENVKGQ